MTVWDPDILIEQLAGAAARTMVLAAIAGLLLAVFRPKAESIRLFTWNAVLYAGLCMPLLAAFLPVISIRVPALGSPVPARVAEKIPHAASAIVPPVQQTATRTTGAALAPVRVAQTAPSPNQARSTWIARTASISWIPWALTLYFAIALTLLAKVLIGTVFARRLVRTSVSVHDPRIASLVSKPSDVLESVLVSVPLTVGVFRPVIVLPASWRDWDADKLTSVLTHEMSHIARRDCLSQHAALLHRAVFWFSPLSWWLNHNIVELAEQASDEEALTRGADRTLYARTLLGFLGAAQSVGRVRWQGVSMASSGRAEKRLEKVLAWRGDRKMQSGRSALIVVLALAIPAAYLVAAARPAKAGQSGATPSSPTEASGVPALPPAPPASSIPGVPAIAGAPAAPSVPGVEPAPPTPMVAAVPVSPLAGHSPGQDSEGNDHTGFSYGYGFDGDQRFVIVSGKSDSFTMSGSGEDARHVEKLRKQIPGDFIWFQRDEKSYIIRDQATIAKALQLWAPQKELGAKQAELGKQQAALGDQQKELGKRMRDIRVSVPDMTAKLDQLKAELQQLGPKATVQDMGRLQGELGRLQAELGRAESGAGSQQGELGHQMGELGRQQGELGRQQGELGRQQGELAKQASQQMKSLLDETIKNGTAQPEP